MRASVRGNASHGTYQPYQDDQDQSQGSPQHQPSPAPSGTGRPGGSKGRVLLFRPQGRGADPGLLQPGQQVGQIVLRLPGSWIAVIETVTAPRDSREQKASHDGLPL